MNMRTLSTLVFAAALSYLAVAASITPNRSAAAGSDIPQIAFEKYTLPNGLDVILSQDHRLPVQRTRRRAGPVLRICSNT